MNSRENHIFTQQGYIIAFNFDVCLYECWQSVRVQRLLI